MKGWGGRDLGSIGRFGERPLLMILLVQQRGFEPPTS
jgi:hypothetical protein